MKTFRLKMMSAAVIITTAVIMCSPTGFAYAGQTKSPVRHNSGQLKKQINSDVVQLRYHQKKIDDLKQQKKDEQAKGIRPNQTNNAIQKAKADLRNEKAHLLADKKLLMSLHRSTVNERRKAVWAKRGEVMNAKARLFASLFKTKPSNVQTAQKSVDASYALQVKKESLLAARKTRNSDLLAINKSIRDVNGQNALFLVVEDSNAKLQNLVMK